jgi:LPS-assembly lipoprotein
MSIRTLLAAVFCVASSALLAGCGFHLRRNAGLPPAMAQRVYLQVNGGGAFARSLAAALRASKVEVLDVPTPGVATLSVPSVAFPTRLLTSTGFQRVGEYSVGMQVQFSLANAAGQVVIPRQTLNLSHEFAIDQTQFSAISSETEAIQRSLVREMTDAMMRRLEAHAHDSAVAVPAVASTVPVPVSASTAPAPAPARSG